MQRASSAEISPQALFQKLVHGQSVPASAWPGYVALAHYDSGVSRPLKQQELQQLVRVWLSTLLVKWLSTIAARA